VRSYVLCFVTEEKLAILEADTCNPQPMTICVLHVVHANCPKPCGTRAPELALVARCRAAILPRLTHCEGRAFERRHSRSIIDNGFRHMLSRC